MEAVGPRMVVLPNLCSADTEWKDLAHESQ